MDDVALTDPLEGKVVMEAWDVVVESVWEALT